MATTTQDIIGIFALHVRMTRRWPTRTELLAAIADLNRFDQDVEDQRRRRRPA